MPPAADSIPTPLELFRLLDCGGISRAEFQQLMAVHAREIIQEMEHAHANPLMARLYQLLNRREAAKWARKHGEALIREILCALAEEPGFPPARWLWNAAHAHIPLDCFFRTRGTPLFRFVKLDAVPQAVTLVIEHGGTDTMLPLQEQFYLRRNRAARLCVERRVVMG
ncbi:MAG: hypothetical protein HS117_22010 [Verrucomicrobiaceae bacterium]|nr:hypothetical protein [Verrucomicrobiaceae bacterium]